MKLGQQQSSHVGHGTERGAFRQAVIRMDHEQFASVRGKAERDGTSLAEAIRTLIEWGLEAEETAE
ncbi:hypothetical protein PVW46_14340 [Mameliella sp. AT18]|uniref:hypothetical protein n=1 Tax=Mameliella sp. AT18 TaxID=3028385 RepID=UPI000841099B|nr:hypothetical protein [Mameliella sp. AT18]MDD9731092.1 hypothetical protein [Mameliella sp. AT18]ODM47236.1 hypothetical protein A9320_23250 [Ruegeria sp. PBVC088]